MTPLSCVLVVCGSVSAILFVFPLTPAVSLSLCPSETLKDYFEQYGSVKEVTIKYDRDTQKSRSESLLLFLHTVYALTSVIGHVTITVCM